jgi:hypothetical protein
VDRVFEVVVDFLFTSKKLSCQVEN